MYGRIKGQYTDVYLIRNERHFKLFNFSDGRVIEPDFVLYLINKNESEQIIFQLFIEPKGTHLLEHDAWKEEFLSEIIEEYQLEPIFENREVKIIGLPFYNKLEREEVFDKKLNSILIN